MTSHELAKLLLEHPDLPVATKALEDVRMRAEEIGL